MEFLSNIKKRIWKRQPEVNSGVSAVHTTQLRMSNNDRVRQLIRHELFRRAIAAEGHETFDEADDFDLPDGEEWVSPYEEKFDPPSDDPTPSKAPPVDPPPGGDPDPAPQGGA